MARWPPISGVTLREPLLLAAGPPLIFLEPPMSAAFGDYDRDGDEDLFCTRWGDTDVLLRNDSGTFVEATPAPLADPDSTWSGTWGDYDNDGFPDLIVCAWEESGNARLYHNDAGADFSVVTGFIIGTHRYEPSWVDYDVDGDLDVYLCADSNPQRLFRNDGNDTFVDVTTGPLFDFFDERHAAWGDYDDDGDPDLFSSRASEGNALLRNDGGLFVDVSDDVPDIAGFAEMGEWVDYDDDGDLDLFVSRRGSDSALLRNDSPGFSDVTPPALQHSFTNSSWQDLDNDGDLDFYGEDTGVYPLLVRNDGNAFVETASVWPNLLSGAGGSWGDVDEDGGIDLMFLEDSGLIPYRNTRLSDENGWLRVQLEGTVSNRSAVGARVTAVTGTKRQMREVTVCGGVRSQNSLVVHFGLGLAPTVDSLLVRWPSGIEQVLTGVLANTELTIVEEAATGVDVVDVPLVFSVGQSYPNPFRSSTRIAFGLPEGSHVNLRIFDVTGRLVRTLRNDATPPGRYTVRWDGRDSGGRPVATGIYFYRFEADDFRKSRRLVRIR